MRFPEFTGEWKNHPLTEFLEFKNGMNPDSKRFGRGTKFISVMDILNNRFIFYDNIRASVETNGNDFENFGVNYGDILFQRSSETLDDVGRANVYLDNRQAIFGGFVIRGKKIGDYNPLFFYYLLSCPYARKRIIINGAGSQHFNISQDGLSKVVLNFSSILEQDKIAEFLNVIDERISTQNKIIEELKQLKSAISNEIFCLPKENQAKRRFVGFMDNWNKIRLNEICARSTRKNKNDRCSRVLTISAQYGLIDQKIFFNKTVASENLTTYYLLEKGDFAYNKSYSGDYIWGTVKRLNDYEEGVISSLYICFVADKGKVDSDFLMHYYESKKWYKGISEIAGEGARNHGLLNISIDDFFNTELRIPCLTEQMKIATILNQLGEKLCSEQTLLTSLKTQKKFLLQHLFI